MNLILYSNYLKLWEHSWLELLKFVDMLQFFFPSNANFSTGPDAIANNHPPSLLFSLFIGKLHTPVGLRPKIPPSIIILQKEEVQFELDLIDNYFSIFFKGNKLETHLLLEFSGIL